MATTLKNPLTDGGYKTDFLGSKFKIRLPELNSEQKKDRVTTSTGSSKLDYIHFSVVMCKSRRLAYYTAVNIDGTAWQNNSRKGSWQDDPRIKQENQLGQRLYSASKSDFDRGHLVRREDPEWGTKKTSEDAGKNTFWFPNCAPQHLKLNQKIWAELEANILHLGADEQNLKINVFTGPVLSDTDGIFVTKVEGRDIQIPNLFWKVVVWTKSNGKCYAVGFLQSQEKFLIEAGIIKKQFVASAKRLAKMTDEDIFEHLPFKDGKTYQVRIEEIEKLTGIQFNWPQVVRPFKSRTPAMISGSKLPAQKKQKARGPEMRVISAKEKIKRTMRITGLTL
jgi:endonuclease G, mitochondrial